MNAQRHTVSSIASQLIELLERTDFNLPTESGPEIYILAAQLKEALHSPQKPRILNEATTTYEVGVAPQTKAPALNHAQTLALIALYERTLQAIIANDKTTYQHHEPRRWDEKRPHEVDGGTIFLTPRELAQRALKFYHKAVLNHLPLED